MNVDEEIVGRIKKVLCEHLLDLDDSVTAETNLFDEGLDSMALMQLILFLEQEFELSIGIGDLSKDNFKTLNAMALFIQDKMSSQS